jgi:IS605 OrfB family transposase
MRQTEPFRALPAKVSQWVLKQVCAAWDSYFAALAAWKADPSRFLGRPRLSKYLDKQGRNLLTYTLQAINQFYNKRRAQLQARLPHGQYNSHQLQALAHKRNRRISDYLHNASRMLINLLVEYGIGTLVIGHNPNWKQAIRLGRRINQNFVSIPYARLIALLTYKAERVGIRVIMCEEGYTSKCSFLDDELIGQHDRYAGRRVHRGLFRTQAASTSTRM